MDIWIVLCLFAIILSVIASIAVKATFSKYNKIAAASGKTAAEVARIILDSHGLHNVFIAEGEGTLTDNYNPQTNTITLSNSVYGKATVGAISVASHEVGHAIQHAEGYAPVQVRTAIVPMASFCSRFWYILFIAGMVFQFVGLIYAAILLFAAVVLFQVVTLPVELDASRRALSAIADNGCLFNYEMKGARKVLMAAAFTYVAALLASLIQLLRLLSSSRR